MYINARSREVSLQKIYADCILIKKNKSEAEEILSFKRRCDQDCCNPGPYWILSGSTRNYGPMISLPDDAATVSYKCLPVILSLVYVNMGSIFALLLSRGGSISAGSFFLFLCSAMPMQPRHARHATFPSTKVIGLVFCTDEKEYSIRTPYNKKIFQVYQKLDVCKHE